jgi:hypothetical protein
MREFWRAETNEFYCNTYYFEIFAPSNWPFKRKKNLNIKNEKEKNYMNYYYYKISIKHYFMVIILCLSFNRF